MRTVLVCGATLSSALPAQRGPQTAWILKLLERKPEKIIAVTLDKRTGAIVVVMQRVHLDDLTGFLLSQSEEWEVLSLPAIAECDEAIPLGGGRVHLRQPLSPEREPLEVLERLKRQIGGDAFFAQYQQSPTPPDGAMVKRQWVRRYAEPPPLAERLYTLQSWDTASKGGPDNDWSVCTRKATIINPAFAITG